MSVVEIPYTPRRLWKESIHSGLDKHRFSVLVCHRRFGKTVGAVNQLIKEAIINKKISPQLAYVAPFQKQAKMIAWNYLKYYTSTIPNVKVNETNLYIEFPSLHGKAVGARLYIVGADNPDVLRGTYWDYVILDEYAQIKPELWGEVVRPSLADREGKAVFLGTPKGQNQFYEIYQRAMANPGWFTACYRADESGVISQDELKSMMEDMTEAEIRQELYCDFTASAFNALITMDMVMGAVNKTHRADDLLLSPKVLGIDVARFGQDSSVILMRQGLQAYEPKVLHNIDNMQLAAHVADEINRHQPDAVFIDAGRGEGVIDRLRQLGYEVQEVNFGGKAMKAERYINRRTEMWDSIRQWLESGGSIPNNPDLKSDLVAPEYSFDAANRMKLEAKEKIKERVGKSPDLADALALTFAYPVSPRNKEKAKNMPAFARHEYDPWK
jgi:Terminase large subunit, T4likevirus-type, N-terminal